MTALVQRKQKSKHIQYTYFHMKYFTYLNIELSPEIFKLNEISIYANNMCI